MPPTAPWARGEQRPLLGLPMTVKEQFNVAGLPTTWGDPKFKDWRPDADALFSPPSHLKTDPGTFLNSVPSVGRQKRSVTGRIVER